MTTDNDTCANCRADRDMIEEIIDRLSDIETKLDDLKEKAQ
jgi:hypothetical protein